jgi:cysteinyl-tRNA synthetase
MEASIMEASIMAASIMVEVEEEVIEEMQQQQDIIKEKLLDRIRLLKSELEYQQQYPYDEDIEQLVEKTFEDFATLFEVYRNRFHRNNIQYIEKSERLISAFRAEFEFTKSVAEFWALWNEYEGNNNFTSFLQWIPEEVGKEILERMSSLLNFTFSSPSSS